MLIDDDYLILEDCDRFKGKTIAGQQYVKVNHKLIEKALVGAGRVCYNALSENAVNVLLNSSAVSRHDVYPATANGLLGLLGSVGLAAELVDKNGVLIDSNFSRNERKILALLVNRVIMSTHEPITGSAYCEERYREKAGYYACVYVQAMANRKMKFETHGTKICLAENISRLSDKLWGNGYFLAGVSSYIVKNGNINSRVEVYRRDFRSRTKNDYGTVRAIINAVLREDKT